MEALDGGGHWAIAADTGWRYVAMTAEQTALDSQTVLGAFVFGEEAVESVLQAELGGNSVEEMRDRLWRVGR